MGSGGFGDGSKGKKETKSHHTIARSPPSRLRITTLTPWHAELSQRNFSCAVLALSGQRANGERSWLRPAGRLAAGGLGRGSGGLLYCIWQT